MLLLVSGASGAGKSTVREQVSPRLDDRFEALELKDLGPLPEVLDVPWRQRSAQEAVRRAAALAPLGRHLLLAGDPVAAGEVLAAPSADRVDVAVCLLDVEETQQRSRLTARGDDPTTFADHVAFATWMRRHAADPTHMPHVLTWFGQAEGMVWDRWTGLARDDPRWATTVIDTSGRSREDVADDVAAWVRGAVEGHVPVFRAGWWRPGREVRA